jgi:hypothetical protein
MDIDRIIEDTTKAARRAYGGSPVEERLAFEVSMLHSRLREMAYLLENATDRVKELEMEIISIRGKQ